MTQVRTVRWRPVHALVVTATIAVAACTGSGSTPSLAIPSAAVEQPSAASTPAATPSPSAGPSTEASPPVAGTPEPTGVATSIDPCQLVTQAEASKLAGASFGPGEESTTSGNGRICTYGAKTKNVFEVVVGIAPDEATAKKEEAEAEAQIQAQAKELAGKGLEVTKLPGFAPNTDAVVLSLTIPIAGSTIGGSAIYLLRGTTFVGFSDLALNQAPPSVDALKAQAMTVLGRLP